MGRLLGFAWFYFRVVVLPVSIIFAAVSPEDNLKEIFNTVYYGMYQELPWHLAWKQIWILDVLMGILSAPIALLSWVIPHWIKWPFLCVAAITGQYGGAVVLWALCWKVPLPHFLVRLPSTGNATA